MKKKEQWTTAAPILDSAVVLRFWGHVARGGRSECWPWTRAVFADGYGCFCLLFDDDQRRVRKASRIAWAIGAGRWPDFDEVVMHTCDNRLCCNPRHLVLGTNDANMADMKAKGRASQGDDHYARKKPERLARGSHVGTSKLTEAQVRTIKRRLVKADGRRGIQKELSLEFGVTRQSIWQIAHGVWWAHIKG